MEDQFLEARHLLYTGTVDPQLRVAYHSRLCALLSTADGAWQPDSGWSVPREHQTQTAFPLAYFEELQTEVQTIVAFMSNSARMPLHLANLPISRQANLQ